MRARLPQLEPLLANLQTQMVLLLIATSNATLRPLCFRKASMSQPACKEQIISPQTAQWCSLSRIKTPWALTPIRCIIRWIRRRDWDWLRSSTARSQLATRWTAIWLRGQRLQEVPRRVMIRAGTVRLCWRAEQQWGSIWWTPRRAPFLTNYSPWISCRTIW